jgi:hypothetical protein
MSAPLLTAALVIAACSARADEASNPATESPAATAAPANNPPATDDFDNQLGVFGMWNSSIQPIIDLAVTSKHDQVVITRAQSER